MKRTLLFISLLLVSLITFSQVNISKEDFDKLPIDVQNKITGTKTDGQIETAGKWVGFGKEVGTAVNESLKAVTGTAVDFSKTSLGKITVALVIYKVIGSDIIRVLFGILWLILVFTISIYIHLSYGRDKKILKSEKYNIESKKYDREWSIQDGNIDFATASIVILVLGLLASVPMFLSI
jgi:uncharacterized protein YxeA